MLNLLLLATISGAYAVDPVPAEAVPAAEAAVPAEAVPAVPAAEAAVPADAAVPVEKAEIPAEGAEVPEVKIPETEAQALESVKDTMTALQMGQWGLAIALIAGLALFVYKFFLKKA